MPAMPARKATTKDIQSGFQMKAVLGRAASTIDFSNSPRASSSQLKPAVSTMAAANPASSAHSDRHTSCGALRTSAVEIPASGPNSGPTAIAPTIRIALSSITPQAASIVATARNAT